MPNKPVQMKNSVSSIESKRNQKKLEGETKAMTFGFEIKIITDTAGNKMKCRMLTWTDLAILSAIHGIRCPAFLSYVRNEEDIFYAIFTDAFLSKEDKEIYYAVELGGYDAVAGSRINHDSEEAVEMWEKMSPKREK